MSKSEKNPVASGDREELVPRNGATSIVWTSDSGQVTLNKNKLFAKSVTK